jgi:hypothetical protein
VNGVGEGREILHEDVQDDNVNLHAIERGILHPFGIRNDTVGDGQDNKELFALRNICGMDCAIA